VPNGRGPSRPIKAHPPAPGSDSQARFNARTCVGAAHSERRGLSPTTATSAMPHPRPRTTAWAARRSRLRASRASQPSAQRSNTASRGRPRTTPPSDSAHRLLGIAKAERVTELQEVVAVLWSCGIRFIARRTRCRARTPGDLHTQPTGAYRDGNPRDATSVLAALILTVRTLHGTSRGHAASPSRLPCGRAILTNNDTLLATERVPQTSRNWEWSLDLFPTARIPCPEPCGRRLS